MSIDPNNPNQTLPALTAGELELAKRYAAKLARFDMFNRIVKCCLPSFTLSVTKQEKNERTTE